MDEKSALTSKGVIGSVVVLLGAGAQMAGYDIGDQGMLVNNLMELIGGGLALYGRVKAVKKISTVI